MLIIRSSSIHEAGCYTTAPIRKGRKVIEYTGPRISNREGERRREIDGTNPILVEAICGGVKLASAAKRSRGLRGDGQVHRPHSLAEDVFPEGTHPLGIARLWNYGPRRSA